MSLLTSGLTRDQAPTYGQYWWWQGASGQWYIHTIEPFSRYLPYDEANYIFVRRDWTGRCWPIYIGQSSSFGQRLTVHEKFDAAWRLGANEIHVHLLSTGDRRRFDTETDLRQGQPTALNEQPSMAGGLFGIGARSRLYSV